MQLVVCDETGLVKVADVRGGAVAATCGRQKRGNGVVASCAFAAGGAATLATWTASGAVELWDPVAAAASSSSSSAAALHRIADVGVHGLLRRVRRWLSVCVACGCAVVALAVACAERSPYASVDRV